MEKMRSNKRIILLLVLPALIIYSLALPLPILNSIRFSFFDWNIVGDIKFIGFDNYIRLFKHDIIFYKALKNTFVFTMGSILLQLPFSLFLALVLCKGVKGSNIFRNVFFFPVTISGAAIGLLWQFIYHPELGMVNGVLSIFTTSFENKVWLADSDFALYAVIISVAWQWIGYHTVLFMTGIIKIPAYVVEAARIDGVTTWGMFRYITLPLLKPVVKISLVLIVTGSIKAFDNVFALTGGGPAHASEVLALHMYTTAFQEMRYGYGSAISSILIALCIVFTIIISRAFKQDTLEF